MTEEANDKKVGGGKSCCVCSKPSVKVIIGVVLIIIGLAAVISWWPNLLALLKGCIGLFLIMAGAIAIAIAKE